MSASPSAALRAPSWVSALETEDLMRRLPKKEGAARRACHSSEEFSPGLLASDRPWILTFPANSFPGTSSHSAEN